MNNKKLYQDTFDQLVMSEEGLRKVMDMSENNKKRYLGRGMRAAAAVMVLAVLFAVGNIAVYAATGDSLVMKMSEKVSVYINGEKAEAEDLEKHVKKNVDQDGNTQYEIDLPDENETAAVVITENEDGEMDTSWEVHTKTAGEDGDSQDKNIAGSLQEKGKKVFLIIGNIGEKQKKVDITKDFSDGRAKGTVKYDGKTCRYTVTGTVQEHKIIIEVD